MAKIQSITWTKTLFTIFAATSDFATHLAAYAAERSTLDGSLPEKAPPPCAPHPPYVSTIIFLPVKPASPYSRFIASSKHYFMSLKSKDILASASIHHTMRLSTIKQRSSTPRVLFIWSTAFPNYLHAVLKFPSAIVTHHIPSNYKAINEVFRFWFPVVACNLKPTIR